MEVVGTVVDPNCSLVGLMLEGKESEFGGMSNIKTMKRIPIANIPNGFKTSKVTKRNGRLEVKGNFRLYDLDKMEVLIGQQCTQIPNNIRINKVYTAGNDIVGFEVQLYSGIRNFRKEDVARISAYFKPENYIVREVNGKSVIAGKPGFPNIGELPTIDLKDDGKSKRKGRMKPVKDIKPIEEYKEVAGIETDIISILDYLQQNGGYIVKLPGERYKAVGETKIDYEGGFKPVYDVEVAMPILKFGEKKLNATIAFRKLGIATSEETGNKYETQTITSKSIFRNGVNTMKNIGVWVPLDNVSWFSTNPKLKTEKVNDEKADKVLRKLTSCKKEMRLLSIDLSEIGIIEDKKRSSKILTNDQIKENCLKMYEFKLMSKYLSKSGELMKGIKKRLGEKEYARLTRGGVYFKYKNLSADELKDIKAAGINILTGEYNRYTTGSGSETSAEAKDTEDMFIEYVYGGMDYTKITGKQVVTAAKVNNISIMTQFMIQTVNNIENLATDEEKIEQASKIQAILDKEIVTINKQMWEHRAAMLLEGRMNYIHTHDKKSWAPDVNSKAKKYNVYINTDYEGLSIRFTGVAI